ncbi:MAG: patatin-like phospholipase family protein [Proteobacteria bacterium]|nr:patatin-like phospholipase family protein [Pseudomonadota bacterium]
MSATSRSARAAAVGVALLACASVPTPELSRWERGAGYRVDLDRPAESANRTFVVLTFSGGGTRAAAFSYGVLKRLRDERIGTSGGGRLLDEVDVISSVSGGSFTAAYYGLFGDRIFRDFEGQFLYVDIQARLARQLWNPVNWARLASPWFSRIDLAVEYYDEHLFARKRYADLGDERPFVLINATHLATGNRFTFAQGDFDPLCADLSQLPVARAVASSSAFPGLLSPVTLESRAGACGYEEEEWIGHALDPTAPVRPARRVSEAQRLQALADRRAHRWVHLIDGGVADNIGLRGPLWAVSTLDAPWSALARMNLEEIDRLVVVIVDAKTDPENDLGRKRRTPSLVSTLYAAATVPMGHYSFDTIELFREHIDQANKDAALAAGCAEPGVRCPPGAQFHTVAYHPIVVQFDAERDPEVRRRLKSMATSFALDAEDVTLLIDAGDRLLAESVDYQRLLAELR